MTMIFPLDGIGTAGAPDAAEFDNTATHKTPSGSMREHERQHESLNREAGRGTIHSSRASAGWCGAGRDGILRRHRGDKSTPPPRLRMVPCIASRVKACGRILAARFRLRPSFAGKIQETPPPKKKGRWSAGRRQGRGPRHADGCYHPLALRARRAPQNDPLARTACFGRAAPPGAPPRLSPRRPTGRPPRRKTASALPIGGRRRPPSTRVIRIPCNRIDDKRQ